MTTYASMTAEEFAKMADEQVARREIAKEVCPFYEGQTLRATSVWGTLVVTVQTVNAPFGLADYNRWELRAAVDHSFGYVSVGFNEHEYVSGAVTVEVLE